MAWWGQGKLQGGFRHRCVSCGLGLSQKPRLWKDQHFWICRVPLRLQLRSGRRLAFLAQLLLMASEPISKSQCLSQWRVALSHNKKKRHVKFFFQKTKYALYTARGALFSTMRRSRSVQSYIGALGGNRGSKRSAWAKTRTEQRDVCIARCKDSVCWRHFSIRNFKLFSPKGFLFPKRHGPRNGPF